MECLATSNESSQGACVKVPTERFASAAEIERQLEACQASGTQSISGINLTALARQSKRPSVAIPILVILLTLVSLSARWLQRNRKVQWARMEAIPQISELIKLEKWGEAYALAVQAEKYVPDDPVLAKFWPAISWTPTIRTTPSGVNVLRRNYGDRDGWEPVGRSPIEKRRFAFVDSQWRFELRGFVDVERATVRAIPPSRTMSVTLDEEAKAPAGMVHQTDAISESGDIGSLESTPAMLAFPGFEDLPSVRLKDYWIDRFEVTNRVFKQFLDIGGYRKREYWKHEFRKDGRTLSWEESMALFRDTTGRAGPSTWIQGEYPTNQDDYPVTGVSWYEALAYAEFAGKTLPTIYQWITAASPWAYASVVPFSNFAGKGPARVGAFPGMSLFGAYDMGGNVKEWCWNAGISEGRFILGGAWDEPLYMFNNADVRSPFGRSAHFGFRCVRYRPGDTAGKAGDPVLLSIRDFRREKPVSDALFRVFKSLFSYDKTPLHAVVESAEATEDWKREKVTFAAAYGNERVIAYLFLPKKSQAPFQTVLYFPGSEAIDMRSSTKLPEMFFVNVVIKSGRAVLFPVYKGTFERGDGIKSDVPNTSSSYRDHVIAWSKDLGRSIDYLETRPEIDRNKISYLGYSWGAAMGSVMPAVEDRIKACVLISPGFDIQNTLPEVDEKNFAPHVRVPVLMLNGRFDYGFPIEISQEPMFRLLGTSKEQKRRVVYNTAHDIPPNELIKETLDWLDRYLGPAK